jgi:hypothetical protein
MARTAWALLAKGGTHRALPWRQRSKGGCRWQNEVASVRTKDLQGDDGATSIKRWTRWRSGSGSVGSNWVLDCDIQSFFDKVSREWLIPDMANFHRAAWCKTKLSWRAQFAKILRTRLDLSWSRRVTASRWHGLFGQIFGRH